MQNRKLYDELLHGAKDSETGGGKPPQEACRGAVYNFEIRVGEQHLQYQKLGLGGLKIPTQIVSNSRLGHVSS